MRAKASTAIRYHALDALRGICAVLVCLFHFRANNPFTEAPLIRGSWQFVDLFFVLSGFVIAASYSERLTNGMLLRRFALLRLARLYPLHLAILIVFVGFELGAVALNLHGLRAMFDDAHAPSAIVTNLLLLQSFGLHHGLTWNGPAWSIAAEFWTCLLFALGVRIAGFRSWWLILLASLAAVGLAIIAPRGIASTADWGFLRCVYGFAVGALCWQAMQHFDLPAPEPKVGTMLETAVILCAVVFVVQGGGLAAPFVFAPVVLVFAIGRGIISAFLRLRIFQLLGSISYSVYLLHTFIQARLDDVLRASGVDATVIVHGIRMLGRTEWEGIYLTFLMLGLVILVSGAAYILIELRAQEWGRRITNRLLNPGGGSLSFVELLPDQHGGSSPIESPKTV